MRILIDIGHPGQVHFFKNLIWEMKKKDHEIKVTARDKDVAKYLLDHYGFDYTIVLKHKKSLLGKILGYTIATRRIENIGKIFKADLFLSCGSVYAAKASEKCKKPHIAFDQTEHSVEQYRIYEPYTDIICTPSCFLKNLGPKQVRYNGYHELTYLHPSWFKPNFHVLNEIGLEKNERFSVVRFISWKATHDIGHKRSSTEDKVKIVRKLNKYGKVFITSEGKLPKELEEYEFKIAPEKIHDLLYYAQIYVGDGGTMANEAAVLGTPSILTSSLAKYSGTPTDLQNNYELLYIKTNISEVLNKINDLLNEKEVKKIWKKRREKMLKDKIDVTKWMIDFVGNYSKR